MLAPTNIMGSPNKSPLNAAQGRSSKNKDVPTTAAELAAKLPDTDGWLTRNEASDMLRCSPQTLKNYENRGLLHPRHSIRRDRSGIDRTMLVYNPKELSELPSRNPGGQPRIAVVEPKEQAARAFELFRAGWELDSIVIELREDPDRIDQLHEHWLHQTKARHVITPAAKQTLEQLVGPFTSVTELVDLITLRLAAGR